MVCLFLLILLRALGRLLMADVVGHHPAVEMSLYRQARDIIVHIIITIILHTTIQNETNARSLQMTLYGQK